MNKSGEAFPLEWSTIVSVEGHSFNSAIVVPWSFATVIFHGESKWKSPRKKAFVFLKGLSILTTVVFRGGIPLDCHAISG